MMQVGSVIIGIITGIVCPIYDFGGAGFSGKNLIILLCLVSLWLIIFSASNKNK